jgi:hypothetical protein
MTFLLVGTAALWLCWFLIGRAALVALAGSIDPQEDHVEWTILLGAFVLAIAAQVVHFFLPLPSRPSALWAAGAFLVFGAARRNDVRWFVGRARDAAARRPAVTLAFVVLATAVACCAARPCKVEDTENYHAQVLRWSEAAPLVPGLALVHGRLAFNSLWFPLEALLSFAFLGTGPMPLANTATFLLGLLYLVRQSCAATGSRLHTSLAMAALVPYVAVGFLFAGSQSPDLPALTFGLLAFFAAAQALQSPRAVETVLALAIAGAATAWKLSVAPLMLFVPILVWHALASAPGRRPWAPLLRTGLLLLLAGGCFVARSVVLSGYAFFPSTAFDVFPVSWKAPALAHGQQVWVLLFARGFRTENPAEALAYPLSQWLPLWLKGLSGPARITLGMLASGLALFPLTLAVPRLRAWWGEGNRRVLVALGSTAVAGTAFWGWQAPDVRFGASYLTALLALCCLPWTWLLDPGSLLRQTVAAAGVAASGLLVAGNLLFAAPVPPWCPPDYLRAHPGRLYWLLPAPYPEASFVEERLGDGSVNHVVASGGLAHYGPVPNSPLPIAGLAVRRGPRLADGYRLDLGR